VVPLPKTNHLERAKENIAVFDFTMKDEDIKRINDLEDGFRVVDPKREEGLLNLPVFAWNSWDIYAKLNIVNTNIYKTVYKCQYIRI